MAKLKRDGLVPLTDEFAERYRLNEAEERHPIGEDITPEKFRKMLEPLGITSAKELAAAVGVQERQARNLLNEPHKLTSKHLECLKAIAAKRDKALYDKAWDARSAALFDDEGKAGHLENVVEFLDERIALLERFSLPAVNTAGVQNRHRAIRDEYQARALLEGFRLLDAGGRSVLLGALCGLLHVSGSDGACAMAESIEATGYGAGTVGEPDLANLVSAEAIGGDAEARSVLEEYAGPVKKRKG